MVNGETVNDFQWHNVSISVYTGIFHIVFSGALEDEKYHPPIREPFFLCVG